MTRPSLARRVTAEAVGTFVLVFIGPGAAVVHQWTGGAVSHVGVALAFFLVVTAMVFTLGPLSGAHINPAVTLTLGVVGRFPLRETSPYIAAQLVGAVAASILLGVLFPLQIGAALTLPHAGVLSSLLVEALLSVFLMLVIMRVVSGPPNGGAVGAFMIGAAVGLDALMGGPVTGASMNPARSFGPALAAGVWKAHWLYWLGPIAGSLAGARLYLFLTDTDSTNDEP